MKKWLKSMLAIMLIAVLMPVTSSFAVEEKTVDLENSETDSLTTEDEIVKITQSDGLSVIGCSSYSEETNDTQPPENAIDGNLSTIWHSDYVTGTDGFGFDKERYLVFDLGKEYYLSKVIYYPRQEQNVTLGTGYNGIFKDCDIYGKKSENDVWFLLKSEKGWARDNTKKEVYFETPSLVRYVKVVGVSTYANNNNPENKFASAAEIEFYGKSAPAYDCMIERENGNYYGSFADAVNNAQNGETVKLLRDVELSQAITINGVIRDKIITIDGHNDDSNFTINLSNPSNNISPFFTITGSGAKVIFDGVTVDGGAVWSGNTDQTLQRGTENTGKAINSTFIYLFNRADLDIINGCVFQNFDSNKFAGLIYAYNNPTDWVSDNIKLNITDSTIKNNTITGNGTVIYGGGSIRGGLDINIKSSEIYGNQNKNNGTADIDFGSTMYLSEYTNLSIDGGIIHNNDGGRYGGAAVAYGANVTVGDNALIEKNKAQRGGAFALTLSNSSTLTLNDCIISQNNAEAEGGAVYVNNGTVNVDNGAKLEKNSANSSGGAVFLAGGILNLNECQFNNNTSKGTGGAISLNTQSTGIVNLGNASFSGNKSNDYETYDGGTRSKGNAIFYFGGTLNITGQPILTENDDIYVEYTTGSYSNFEKINIVTNSLEEKSITVTPQYCKTYHFIAEIDPSIQDTVDKQAILKAFYFPKELNLDETAFYIKGNEMFYGDPVNLSKDIPQTMIEFTDEVDEENPTYNFELSVEATGTDITYQWYESDTAKGTYTLMENETGSTLNITNMGEGKKYYYCEIDNGELSSNGPYKSTICKVEVSEFYPCSQAIAKFERV